MKPDEEHVLWPFDGEYWRDELGLLPAGRHLEVWEVDRDESLRERTSLQCSAAGVALVVAPLPVRGRAAAKAARAAASARCDECISHGGAGRARARARAAPKQFDVGKHGKTPQMNFKSAPPPADLKKGEQQTEAEQPDVER